MAGDQGMEVGGIGTEEQSGQGLKSKKYTELHTI